MFDMNVYHHSVIYQDKIHTFGNERMNAHIHTHARITIGMAYLLVIHYDEKGKQCIEVPRFFFSFSLRYKYNIY